MSHLHLTDDRMHRTIPIDAAVGTIEIDLSGDERTITVPAGVSVERR